MVIRPLTPLSCTDVDDAFRDTTVMNEPNKDDEGGNAKMRNNSCLSLTSFALLCLRSAIVCIVPTVR
jgi:hypothetical protein